jgi:RNA polymerase sigma-70 factor (ECF subfamily)
MGTTREMAFERARARWPGVVIGFEVWNAHLDALGWLEELPLHTDSLYLCCACAQGDAAACRSLEEEYVPYLRGVAGKVDRNPEFVDEILQLARHRLLTGPTPKIATYTGGGQLQAWLRVVVNHLALDQKRSKKGARKHSLALQELWADAAAELPDNPAMRGEYAKVFERCLREVVEALPIRDRTLVRLYYLQGLNIDGIGRMYGKDRATAARWLQRCRERMQGDLKERIQRAFGKVNDAEFESLVRLVHNEIDLSISVLLSAEPASDDPPDP